MPRTRSASGDKNGKTSKSKSMSNSKSPKSEPRAGSKSGSKNNDSSTVTKRRSSRNRKPTPSKTMTEAATPLQLGDKSKEVITVFKKTVIHRDTETAKFYRFGGPLRCHVIIISMITLVFLLYQLVKYPPRPFSIDYCKTILFKLINSEQWISLFNWKVWMYFVMFLKFQNFLAFAIEKSIHLLFKIKNVYLCQWYLLVCMLTYSTILLTLSRFHPWLFNEIALYWPSFLAAAGTTAALGSLFLFARSYISKVNVSSYAKSGCYPYKYLVGCEINPVITSLIGSFDVKKLLLWNKLALWMTFDMVWAHYANVWTSNSMQIVLGVHLLWIFSKCFHQRSTTMNLVANKETVGFLFTFCQLLLSPFLVSLSLFANAVKGPSLIGNGSHFYYHVWSVLFACTGIWMYNASISIRTRAIHDPYNKVVLARNAIITSNGARLVVDGLFSWVRFPDMLGEVLIILSTGLAAGPCTCTVWLVVIFQILVFTLLAKIKDESYAETYGKFWLQYCEKYSPSLLLPFRF